MKKGLIIAGVVVAVVGYQFIGGSDDISVSDDVESTIEDIVESMVAEDGTYSGSLSGLSKSDEDWKCTVSLDMEGIKTFTTAYINGDNVRTDSETEAPVMGVMTMSMISDDEYMYSWSSMQPGGYKILIDEEVVEVVEDKEDLDVEMEVSEEVSELSQNVEYKCEKWDVDMSIFELPNVEFEEITI